MIRHLARVLPLVASAAGGAYAAGLILGWLYAWAEPHIANRIGGGAR